MKQYIVKGITGMTITLALLITGGGDQTGAGAMNVYAVSENRSTIIIGDNAPMTREQFMAWREQKGVRYININEQILPPGIFFDGNNGKAFRYGELSDSILHVYLIPGVVSNDKTPVTGTPITEAPVTDITASQVLSDKTPIIFDDITPILFSDDELAAMIESVPHHGPLDTISAITLPNRKLTDSELEAWISEYNEMSGATAFEFGVIREINRVRVQHDLLPLALNPALMMSSRLKTQEFADLQYYNHRSPVHGSVTEAAQMFGYEGSVAECMSRAGGSGAPIFRSTSVDVVAGMLASPPHRKILLHPNLKSVGFGTSFSPNSRGANGNMSHMFYVVTQFGFSYD